MISVADTSPVNYLVLIGYENVLSVLYSGVLLPDGVLRELPDAKAPGPVRAWASDLPAWVEVLPKPTYPLTAMPRLHGGETEAIVAAEARRADWLLIDEKAGRAEALRRGIRIIGVLGILREAHRIGLLDLSQALSRLQRTSFPDRARRDSDASGLVIDLPAATG